MQDCPLCRDDGGELIAKDDLLRVVLVDDPDLPGFARVIVNDHAREMTDLDTDARARLMQAVFAVEQTLREVLAPEKVNLASFGNVVPHVHWHVVPRFADDAFFPQAIWGARQRETAAPVLAARRAVLPVLRERIAEVLRAG